MQTVQAHPIYEEPKPQQSDFQIGNFQNVMVTEMKNLTGEQEDKKFSFGKFFGKK